MENSDNDGIKCCDCGHRIQNGYIINGRAWCVVCSDELNGVNVGCGNPHMIPDDDGGPEFCNGVRMREDELLISN